MILQNLKQEKSYYGDVMQCMSCIYYEKIPITDGLGRSFGSKLYCRLTNKPLSSIQVDCSYYQEYIYRTQPKPPNKYVLKGIRQLMVI